MSLCLIKRQREARSINSTLKQPAMEFLVLGIMMRWSLTQASPSASKKRISLSQPIKCRLFTTTSRNMPLHPCTAFNLSTFSVIRGIAYDTEQDSARARQALATLNEVINHFHVDDSKAIQRCKETTDHFLSATNGSSQHQVTAIGNCHIGMATSDVQCLTLL